MISRHGREGKRGFSLVEMSMVLVIIGAIGLVLWKFLPAFKSLPAIARLTATSLSSAEDALNGFILANGRLPCPATTVGGTEACSASGEWLPARTLGLNLPEPVRYGVYRASSASLPLDADLATLKDRYVPLLPSLASRVPPLIYVQSSNGLDFCTALLNIARTPGTALTAGAQRVPIAYGLAVAGAGDANGDGSPFDGLNRLAGQFELAGASRRADFDDASRAVGAGELLTRLGCITRFSTVNGAARATYAAYDIDRFADLNQRFREFDADAMQGNVDAANLGIAFATVSVVITAAQVATALTQAIISVGGASASTVVALIAQVLADVGLGVAIAAKLLADEALVVANEKLAKANDFKDLTAADLQLAFDRVQALDAKGLLP